MWDLEGDDEGLRQAGTRKIQTAAHTGRQHRRKFMVTGWKWIQSDRKRNVHTFIIHSLFSRIRIVESIQYYGDVRTEEKKHL